MIESFTAIYTAITSAIGTAKTAIKAINLKDASDVLGQLVSAQQALITLQSELIEAREKLHELQRPLEIKSEYKLVNVGDCGALVRNDCIDPLENLAKTGAERTQFFCQLCANKDMLVLLRHDTDDGYRLFCPNCREIIEIQARSCQFY